MVASYNIFDCYKNHLTLKILYVDLEITEKKLCQNEEKYKNIKLKSYFVL